MTITSHPLHRSRRAELPHRALASGDDGQALVGVGLGDSRSGQETFRPDAEAPAQFLCASVPLAAAPQRAVPEPVHSMSKQAQRRTVSGHSVIVDFAVRTLSVGQ